MAFELQPEESHRKGLRRIVREELEDALEALTGASDSSRDEAVHEARKAFKKIRAILRLVRPEIGNKIYRKENTRFRDLGRPLTELRDATILIETFDKLLDHFKVHVVGRSFGDVRRALQDNLRAVRKRLLDEHNVLIVVAEGVRQAQPRVKRWTDVPNRWSAVAQGLKQTYRRARDAFRQASADPTVEKLHEWRKQTKYLLYQLEILRPIWPERMEELACEADRLGEALGDDHDLALLHQLLTAEPGRFGDEGEAETLLALIDRRRAELERGALHLGRRFFEDQSREFARRLKEYWKTWRAQMEWAQPNESDRVPV